MRLVMLVGVVMVMLPEGVMVMMSVVETVVWS